MEQTWYLFPGQTLETTKIKDRGKALIATPAAWKKITDNLDKKKVQQEQIEEELARRRFLKEGSRAMTKDWDNSIEKMQQRRLEQHDLKVLAREEDLIARFMELTAEQAAEREQLVAAARRRMFMVKQDSRTVNSALVLTEVLHERRLQQEFDAEQRRRQRRNEEEYAKLVDWNADQEKTENQEKRRRRKEMDVKYSEELMAQIKKREEDAKKEKEENTKAEIEDHKRSHEEKKAIDEYEFLLDRKKKADVKRQFHEFAIEQKARKEEARQEDLIADKIVNIYARGKCRIDEMKKKREKELNDEKIAVREKLAVRAMAQAADSAQEEAERMDNAVKEYEKAELIKLEKKREYQEKLHEDLLETRRQFLIRKQKEEDDKNEINKWEMANRLKTNEVMEKYEQDKAQRLFDEKIKYRELLNKQIKDDDTSEYDKYCKDQELLYIKQTLDNEDKGFFAYADEILDIAKARGRTTHHIEKAIHQYKVDNKLEPKKKNISHLKSKVPINNKNK